MEAGFGVFGEGRGRGERGVAEAVDVVARAVDEVVDGFGDRAGRCEVWDGWGVGAPFLAGCVEDWVGRLIWEEWKGLEKDGEGAYQLRRSGRRR